MCCQSSRLLARSRGIAGEAIWLQNNSQHIVFSFLYSVFEVPSCLIIPSRSKFVELTHDVTRSSETDLPLFHHTKPGEAVSVSDAGVSCLCKDAKLWFATRFSKLYSSHRRLWCSRTLGRSIEAAPQGRDRDHSGGGFVEKVMLPFRGILADCDGFIFMLVVHIFTSLYCLKN